MSYGVLSKMLEHQIVHFYRDDPGRFYVYNGNRKCRRIERAMDSFVAFLQCARDSDDDIIVVEHDGAGHFAGYLPLPGKTVDMPVWLKKAVKGQ
jgi:hypothetical protein